MAKRLDISASYFCFLIPNTLGIFPNESISYKFYCLRIGTGEGRAAPPDIFGIFRKTEANYLKAFNIRSRERDDPKPTRTSALIVDIVFILGVLFAQGSKATRIDIFALFEL